ncbi:MAG TPA: YciI family protein [Thermoanaerobaculia bacterium]|jgi:hypothetical protein
MPQYMLMLRDTGMFPTDISAEEIQSILLRYRDWIGRIGGAGHKLRDGEGRTLVGKNGVSVTDGPYAESKEILGGYVIIDAESYDDAVQRCQESPHLDYGSIEIRQIEQ